MISHLLLLLATLIEVLGHGRLVEPPSRSSMWRYGFKTETNYNDHELFCGGFTVQWSKNKGRCGVCGDPWHMPQPRQNEAGGKYGKGIIVRSYHSGQVINVTVQITANHRGYFEFKICPTNNPKTIATQECLDQYPLKVERTSSNKYILPDQKARNYYVPLTLPKGLQCSHCVLQWTYTSGNNWGPCPGGRSAVGCGPQETFRGCADVRIIGNGIESSNAPSAKNNEISPKDAESKQTNRTARPNNVLPETTPTKDTSGSKRTREDSSNNQNRNNNPKHSEKPEVIATTESSLESGNNSCKAVGVWKTVIGMDSWCVLNCSLGFCPQTHCKC